MNKNLQKAFELVANGREMLNHIREESPFHNSTWEQAFIQTFDRIEELKTASERDAATLGLIYCKIVGSLIDQLIEEPENRVTLGTLCMMTSYAGRGTSYAQRFFEYTLEDLESEAIEA